MAAIDHHSMLSVTSTWPARLELRIEERRGASLLTHSSHEGPLRVQRPFYPEGPEKIAPHLPPAPSGRARARRPARDEHRSGARRAVALVTTPAATKIYRSDGRRAVQRQHLSVLGGGTLEWLPQETILFDGAVVDLDTTIDLEEGAVFRGVGGVLPRPARAGRAL